MDEKAPKIDDKKFAAHMNKNKKPKTQTSTQKSFADIRKRADSMAQNPKIVRSRKSSPSLRRKLINATEQDMSGMCCKNCGDMYGKPTKENKSCMYNAYDPKGKNWINAEKYHEAMVNPQSNLTKKQRQALASPAAKAKPKSQVSLKKAPWDKKKEQTEAFDFKVNIDGFPEMFMSGNSPSEVKTHLRKLVKQPSMIQSVDRVTKADKKKHHRDKVNEGMKYTHAAVDMKGKVIGMASQESDAKDMARRNKGRVVKLKKPMSDKKGDMMINRPFKEGSMPDEGTPEAKKKASKMTPGQTSKENFFKNLGNKIMGNKPTANQVRRSTGMSSRVNTNRNSTSGNQNSIANRINLGGKYGNK